MSRLCRGTFLILFKHYKLVKYLNLTLNQDPDSFSIVKKEISNARLVSTGDVVLQSLPVDYGIPQGSILGPVLFTVYINDLLTVPKLCQTACYVDDSKLYLKFKTNELCNAVSAVNSDLNEISRWCMLSQFTAYESR